MLMNNRKQEAKDIMERIKELKNKGSLDVMDAMILDSLRNNLRGIMKMNCSVSNTNVSIENKEAYRALKQA